MTQQAVFNTYIQSRLIQNPLVRKIKSVLGRVVNLKERTRGYYFEVILSVHQCPACGGRLHMTGKSECSCSCGNVFDPTLAFQKSPCCGARLVRKTFHYACSRCNKTVPSRFLFDERVFDKSYFREMMRESRRKAKEKREEIRRFLAESRSGNLPLMDDPDLEAIPGLIQDLNDFIQQESFEIGEFTFGTGCSFHMDEYHEHILSLLDWDSILFSEMDPLIQDCRLDRIWRFITLVYLQHDREVTVTQYGNDLLVQKVHDEAYNEGQSVSGASEATF